MNEAKHRLCDEQHTVGSRHDDISQRVMQLQAELAGARAELLQGNERCARLAEEVSKGRAVISAIEKSYTWRMTAGLRTACRLAARFLPLSRAGTTTDHADSADASQPAPASIPVPIPEMEKIEEVAIAPQFDVPQDDVDEATPAELQFDPVYYLKRYADVARAGIDPLRHFRDHGKAEGRSGIPPKLKLSENIDAVRAERDYVVVVSHEATRTGAPILTWNICRELGGKYNVVTLLLGGGEISDYFHASSAVTVGPYSAGDRHAVAISAIVDQLCELYPLRFAIVNSLESRSVLESLTRNSVPSVFLIHEFFKFHCTPDEWVHALAWAGRTVFSASIVRDHAAIERARPAARSSFVIPQGKSVVPNAPQRPVDPPGERTLEKLLARRTSKPFVVLGAGTVEYRKGVDLFIATATAIQQIDPEADILMVWIGDKTPHQHQYAEFIDEQVLQSDLGDRLGFVGVTADIEALYRQADMFFLSSRLDPLPNVALDAMTAGVPVLCFDKASGVAENLAEDPLARTCTVPFLSVHAAAERILGLYRNPDAWAELSERMLQVAQARFDMKRYVDSLAMLGETLRDGVAQQASDVAWLTASEDFIASYYLPPNSPRSREDAIFEYVKSSQSGIHARKALPGFNPHAYAQQFGLTGGEINPLIHFLQAGRPSGAWTERVIDVSRISDPGSAPPAAMRVAVHLHAFYPELAADIVERLEFNDLRCDLFVSVCSEDGANELRSMLATYAGGTCDIRIVPDRGRDIGPMLMEFAADLAGYDVIGHFHTKKSLHVADPGVVTDWVQFLMQNLLGTRSRAARAILSAFANDPALGLVFPDDPNSIGWNRNLPFATELAERMGIGLDKLPVQFFDFPVGTMFWARPQALRPLFGLNPGFSDFPEEPLPIDGSALHAIERLLPVVARHAGYGIGLTFAPGVSR